MNPASGVGSRRADAKRGGRSTAVKRRGRNALREARRSVDRAHLVEAAERVFARLGYERTRMQEIAAEAGLALATLYGLCEGKEELYAAVHETRGRELLERAVAASAGAASAWEALLSGVRAYAEYLAARPDYLRLHLLESQPWALRPRFTSGTQDALWREGYGLTVEVFRAAMVDGTVAGGSPELNARLMIAAHQVFLGDWMEGGMKESPHQLARRMEAYVVRAFGAR